MTVQSPIHLLCYLALGRQLSVNSRDHQRQLNSVPPTLPVSGICSAEQCNIHLVRNKKWCLHHYCISLCHLMSHNCNICFGLYHALLTLAQCAVDAVRVMDLNKMAESAFVSWSVKGTHGLKLTSRSYNLGVNTYLM